jgi:hypothetical protein
VDVPFDQWCDQELNARELPKHVAGHILTMAKLHADNRYDRLTEDVEKVTGEPAMSIRQYVTDQPEIFASTVHKRTSVV